MYFIILGLRSISNLVRIFVVRHYFRYRNMYGLASFLMIDGAFLCWLLYGNIIFFSSSNDCTQNDEQRVLYNLMLTLLMIGYLQMSVYGILIFCIPCAVIGYRINDQR